MQVRNEYPRPQFERTHWVNLNGEWQFDYDDSNQGLIDGWFKKNKKLRKKINVPFVYQSKLSGINEREPHDIVWYKREFTTDIIHEECQWILHFGAVDYEAQIFVNGHLAGQHTGGHTPFSIDVTPFLEGEGVQTLAVRAYDPHTDELIPRGKQIWEDESKSIWYTNSTGIWQTVWLELVPRKRILDVKFTPLFDEGKVNIVCTGNEIEEGDTLEYTIMFKNTEVACGKLYWTSNTLDWDVDIIQNQIFRTNFHNDGNSWTPENPNLYEVYLDLKSYKLILVDDIKSYFGFRKVHTENGMVYLNNKPYYQKLVLDQGYWPDGLLTAPDDQAFITDIQLAKDMGLNGCRKHQKMEDPRFLYWADQMGFLVWGECASTPMYSPKAAERLMGEWAEIVERDYNHPSIVVWVPLNESWGVPNIHNDRMQQHFSQALYHYLHAIDKTRLVISNDGWEMTTTDICAIHNYSHGQKDQVKQYEEYVYTLASKDNLINHSMAAWDVYAKGFSHQGEPILLTEFGGIGFDVSGQPGWGYTSVQNEEEFLEDYGRIMDAVYASKGLWGYCYTQLCDVEQEINGILTYDRRPKCSLEKIKEINDRYHVCRIEQ